MDYIFSKKEIEKLLSLLNEADGLCYLANFFNEYRCDCTNSYYILPALKEALKKMGDAILLINNKIEP